MQQSKHIYKAHKARHKPNLAKELAFLHTGHTLPFVATQTDRVEARTPYLGFAKMGADGSRVSTFVFQFGFISGRTLLI